MPFHLCMNLCTSSVRSRQELVHPLFLFEATFFPLSGILYSPKTICLQALAKARNRIKDDNQGPDMKGRGLSAIDLCSSPGSRQCIDTFWTILAYEGWELLTSFSSPFKHSLLHEGRKQLAL